MKKFLALSLSDVVFIMLINVKMPKIVGILTLMSRINFVLSVVEYEKSFITSGLIFYPGPENLILPILSYPGCHMRAVHWLYCNSHT